MKTTNFIVFAAVVLLLAACSKDNEGGNGIYRLFAENMSNASAAKVLINPSDLSAEWLAGETININNHVFYIESNGSGGYQVNTGNTFTDGTLFAIYPGSSFGGNDVEVTHTGVGSGNTVVLKSLVLNFHDDKHDVVMPMATTGITSSSTSITFEHLTGGMKLTLHNASASPVTLGSLKVVAQSSTAVNPLSHNGVTCRWAVQGPTTPSDTVGQEVGDVTVSYSSEMYFKMKTSDVANVTIAAGGTLSFCVPVTVSSLDKITVVGFDGSGAQLFSKSKAVSTSILRNKMYNIPTININ